MVEGAIEHLQTHYGVAVTGFAGPGGGPEAPVGTIYVAVGTKEQIEVRELRGDDGREENVARATLTALQMLLERLKNDFPLVVE
jgi:nicotinamide mononucleotide (NMN) deamidase PncC